MGQSGGPHDLVAITEQGKYPCLIQGKLRHTEETFKTEAQARLTLKKLITPALVRNLPGPSSGPSNAEGHLCSPMGSAVLSQSGLLYSFRLPHQGHSPAPMTSGAG